MSVFHRMRADPVAFLNLECIDNDIKKVMAVFQSFHLLEPVDDESLGEHMKFLCSCR